MIAKKGALGIIIAIIVLAVIVIGAVVYYSGSKSNYPSSSISTPSQQSTPSTPTQPTTTPTTTPSSPASTASVAVTREVKIKDFKFVPADITVKVGDTIKWTNEDSAAHTATASDGAFDTDRLAQGESGSHTFTSADVGTHSYICSIHPSMKGTVTVTSS